MSTCEVSVKITCGWGFSAELDYLHGDTKCFWRERYIFVNSDSKEIIAHEVTDDSNPDAVMIGGRMASSG